MRLRGSDEQNKKYIVQLSPDQRATLDEATWANSTLIKGNIAEEVARLKQQPGKDIAISDSGTLVQTLLGHDLVDELNLLVYPVVLGRGSSKTAAI